MRLKLITVHVAVALLLASCVLAQQGAQAKNGEKFGNADVLALLQAGIASGVIMAKIKQAPEVDFELETENLVALNKAGASPEVISEMLARATPASEANPKAAPSFNGIGPNAVGTAILVTREGRIELKPSRGEFSATGFAFVQMAFFNYPGLHANIKTTDRRPSVLINSEFDPAEHYFIGKLDPDTKINARSLKIKGKGRAFSVGSGVRPDEEWVVAYTASEEEKGIWKLTPNIDMEPGEYGLFDGIRLFGFSVVQ